MRKKVITPTFVQFIKEGVRAGLLDTHTSMPGKIKEYDKDTQKASIIPLLKKKFKDTNETIVDLPVLNNVPVHNIVCNNRKTYMYFPVKVGDPGMLHFCERSIDNYLSSTPNESKELIPVYHDSPRHHDLSDAWFVPGILPFSISLQNVPENDIIIKNDQLTITIDPSGKIKINNDSNELFETLSTLINNLINAKVITMLGSMPFITDTITALTQDKNKIDSFKV